MYNEKNKYTFLAILPIPSMSNTKAFCVRYFYSSHLHLFFSLSIC